MLVGHSVGATTGNAGGVEDGVRRKGVASADGGGAGVCGIYDFGRVA